MPKSLVKELIGVKLYKNKGNIHDKLKDIFDQIKPDKKWELLSVPRT